MGSSWDDARRHSSGWGDHPEPPLGGTRTNLFRRRQHRWLAEAINQAAIDMLDVNERGDGKNHSVAAFIMRGMAEKLAGQLRRDNAKFDDAAFIEACLKGWW